MKIVICLDEQNGYMFNSRRQSLDRVVRSVLLEYLDGKPLWMSQYTKEQFIEDGNYIVDDSYETNAGESDYCFVEDKGYSLENCHEIVIFRWKRKYPYDKSFDVDILGEGFKRKFSKVFDGYSHEKIRFEVYIR